MAGGGVERALGSTGLGAPITSWAACGQVSCVGLPRLPERAACDLSLACCSPTMCRRTGAGVSTGSLWWVAGGGARGAGDQRAAERSRIRKARVP